jgi:FkbM family methyltransferase
VADQRRSSRWMRVKAVLLSWAARRQWQPLWRATLRVAIGGLGHMNADPALNGEDRLLSEWAASLKRQGRTSPVVLDVGANEGDFAAAVLALLPEARLVCFEPHPRTAARLAARFADRQSVVIRDVAVSDRPGGLALHDYQGGEGSAHASLLADTFTDVYAAASVSFDVDVVALDDMLVALDIERVDLVKIDVEGSERAVLVGMKRALAAGRIDRIQFEFNAHNALTGLTLHEVGRLLAGFDLYKILPNGLVPVFGPDVPYDSQIEIFKYANYVGLRRAEGVV